MPQQKKPKVLTQYRGPLTPTMAAKGIQAATTNAQALLSDAQLLIESGRWQRAAALCILAIEEAGKIPIIRSIVLARDDAELKEGWNAYRKHTLKNVMHIVPALVAAGARKLDDFRSVFDNRSDHPELLDVVKQIAFYPDACGNCNWSLPENVINEALARQLFTIASLLVPKGDQAFSTEAELIIWVKHMKPVFRRDKQLMQKALLDSYAEAKETGVLKGKYDLNKMMDFIHGKPSTVI